MLTNSPVPNDLHICGPISCLLTGLMPFFVWSSNTGPTYLDRKQAIHPTRGWKMECEGWISTIDNPSSYICIQMFCCSLLSIPASPRIIMDHGQFTLWWRGPSLLTLCCYNQTFVPTCSTFSSQSCSEWREASRRRVVLQTINRGSCTITEKANSKAFSWLKAHTSAFTFKTLLRHYAKWALTPW